MARRTLDDLREEMRAVARGERAAPPVRDGGDADVVAGMLSVLTPANLTLMRLIASERPASVSKLAELSGRSQPNVSRALQDLAKRGLVRLAREGMTIRPELAATGIGFDLVHGTCVVTAAAE